MCPASASCTSTVGSHTYGKVLGSRFGGPSVKTRNGTGVERTAIVTMFASSAKHPTFHRWRMSGGISRRINQSPRMPPVMPATISKLRPV
jgi:hypothetical protein